MTALQLITRLREQGIRITAVDGELELDAPVGALTSGLREELLRCKPELLRLLSWSRRSGHSATLPLQAADRDQQLPLSWAQQRLWFLDQLEPGSSAYNISWTVRLQGELNKSALQVALNKLVIRHETLRTCFPSEAGVPHQQIEAHCDINIEFEELVGVSDEKLRARLAYLAAQSFDLGAGPLLRVHVLRLSDTECILMVLIHHIVSDGASMRVLFRELAALYEAELDGSKPVLPILPVQYADYSVWQRNWLDGEELDRQVLYWEEQLAGLPPLLELPWDRPRSAAMRYRGASVLRVLPVNLADELRALGRAQGCTLFMVMLAAFYVLLMRYSGREDLVLGTPMGGRPRTDLEGLIGFFINTVVLRADLSGDPTFAELMQAVRNIALEAHANQELPFEKLVEVLQPERELSYSPVFQVMFDLQEEPRWRLPVRNLEVVPEVVFSSRTSSFDLTLSVRQAESGLDAMFEYDTDLFDEASIERMAAHYQVLLESVVADADKPISSLPIIDELARKNIVDTWGSLTAPYPEKLSLVALFERQVRERPEAVAVVAGEADCSYAELNRRANRLAFRLQSLGIVTGQSIALCVERSVNGVAAMLAVLKAGACLVPLDPDYPVSRLQAMLDDSGAAITLLEPDHQAATHLVATSVISLSDDLFTSPYYPDQNPQCLLQPDDLAFLLYTSGSTGKPKGTELPHRGLVNYLHQLGLKTNISPSDRVLQFASLSFDISVEEIFSALLHGATLVLREQGMNESIDAFIAACERHRITWLSLPTAWWHELCANLNQSELKLPGAIRSMIIGGERAQYSAFIKWHKMVDTRVQLINTYGPTETSIAATWCDLTHLDPQKIGELPIGHPVPNVRAWVLDEYLQPLPPGVPGELYIGGVGVAQGYHNNAEQTEQSFVKDVLNPEQEDAKLYRTGDRARYLADGQLVFMGRLDDQVKVRGHRIELGEVEAALLTLHDVEKCAVILRDARLVAYVCGEVELVNLGARLASVLPEYMVPSVFRLLDNLPLTANGKLDKKALPALALMRDEREAYVEPRTEIELQLVAIWSEVLGVERIGIHDDFFALGGHSLIATRVVARVRDLLGHALPLRALFNQPTVAGLASLLVANPLSDESVPLQPRPATG
ncbi:MAG: amino acid adenylation domain-containing protein, partial [Gammaproteobacteria bacterium]|nr:amino acid adenylation domain-containing protein [Gammaproteobacteria bacterium]MCP4928073.1 amino acid adenylation domain-containing protein [Gammaproteobacteria bacterium]